MRISMSTSFNPGALPPDEPSFFLFPCPLATAHSSGHVEDVPLVVRRRDGELLAVGAPGDAVGHRVGGDLLVEQRLGGLDVPDVEVAAVADRGEPLTVGAEGQRVDVVGVAVELAPLLAVLDVP